MFGLGSQSQEESDRSGLDPGPKQASLRGLFLQAHNRRRSTGGGDDGGPPGGDGRAPVAFLAPEVVDLDGPGGGGGGSGRVGDAQVQVSCSQGAPRAPLANALNALASGGDLL